MASKGDYYEARTLEWLLNAGGVAPSRPTARKVKLFTTMPNEANSGGVEVSTSTWSNYAQQDASFGAVSGTSPTQCANAAAVDFGTAVCSADVTVLGFAVVDQSDRLIYGPYTFGNPQIVQSGNPVSFPVGSLICTED